MDLFFADLFTVNGRVVQNYEVHDILIFVFCPNRFHFRSNFFFRRSPSCPFRFGLQFDFTSSIRISDVAGPEAVPYASDSKLAEVSKVCSIKCTQALVEIKSRVLNIPHAIATCL